MRKKIQSIVSILLATLFLSYHLSTVLFFHTHESDIGQVTHSHPYLPSGAHSHTAGGFQAIDSLTHFALLGVPELLFEAPYVDRIQHLNIEGQISRAIYFPIEYFRLRPPPFVC